MFPSPSPNEISSSSSWPAFASIDELNNNFQSFCDRAERVLGFTKSTRLWYRDGFGSFVRFLTETGTDWPLVVSPDLLEQWLAWSRTQTLSLTTIHTYWKSLKAFIDAIVRQAGLSNPFAVAHSPKLPQHRYKALAPAECERLLSTVLNYPWRSEFERARNAAIIGVALYAGLRKREIIRLEYRDVDLEQGTIFIRRGKGKNGGKDRTAYIASELRTFLSAYVRERRARQITAPEFFNSSVRPRGISPVITNKLVKQLREASGIKFSLHVLRHSFVTMLLRSGVPIHIARDLAGHASIQSTEGYARVFREDLKQHIQAVRFRN
jgi:site-specific recombinase XerD